MFPEKCIAADKQFTNTTDRMTYQRSNLIVLSSEVWTIDVLPGTQHRWVTWNRTAHVQGHTQESQKSISEDSLSNQVTWDGVFLQTFSGLNVPEAHGVITRARAQLWAIYKMNKNTLQYGIWDFVVKVCYCLRVCSPGPTAIPLTTSSWPQNSWTGSVSPPKSHISTVLSRDALKIKELPLKQHN